VTLLDDSYVQRLFLESNIESHDRDKYLRILDGALREKGIPSSEVLAVSRSDLALVVVCKTYVFLASQRGVFNKRVEIANLVAYSKIVKLVQEEDGYKDRRESLLEAVDADSQSLLRFKWEGWLSGSSVTASDAATERDRILNIMLRLMNDASGSAV
jgi:hypothetical protein